MNAPVTAHTREAQAARDLLTAYKDIIGEDAEFAADVVEGQTDFVEIVDHILNQEGEDAALVEAIQDRINKLSTRALNINARIEKRRGLLITALQMAGLKSLRCPVATISLRATPQKAIVTQEDRIPEEFLVPRDPTIDRRALLAALKEGRKIPGAELSNGGVSLSIRTA
jgi:hypothetical protein